LTKIIFYIKFIFIYDRSKIKLIKGQLARNEIPLDNSSAPLSSIRLSLKIWKENIQKPNNRLFKNNINTKKKKLKYLIRK
jgi:hypothetical protein